MGRLLPADASFYLKDSIKRQKIQENSSSNGAVLRNRLSRFASC